MFVYPYCMISQMYANLFDSKMRPDIPWDRNIEFAKLDQKTGPLNLIFSLRQQPITAVSEGKKKVEKEKNV